ncbi:hypothetical protein EON67_03055 [archaeon]|nr:MAG: hypothetical protein EON67_03055 [archaeon]
MRVSTDELLLLREEQKVGCDGVPPDHLPIACALARACTGVLGCVCGFSFHCATPRGLVRALQNRNRARGVAAAALSSATTDGSVAGKKRPAPGGSSSASSSTSGAADADASKFGLNKVAPKSEFERSFTGQKGTSDSLDAARLYVLRHHTRMHARVRVRVRVFVHVRRRCVSCARMQASIH